MRRQLRPFYTPDQLAQVYARPYDHTRWADHVERVARTVQVLDVFAAATGAETVADLSCGDGAIVAQSTHLWRATHLGDYTTTGPIEQTLATLPQVDMFVCSETLEHVEDPDGLLAGIRARASHLLLTTPCGEDDDANPEHYWGWDTDDLREMLTGAGWSDCQVELFTPQSVAYYTFQIWTCTRR
ncbi:hypothetical protein Sme01_03130 [Sphaerisporangium melleum]|uniref:Uncharacterized protein n=1 Tax=Sphaerisporangium melleum TaxID=321316 RepID=A0A917VC17_9ACTN|nr:hypothetical protein [Sphaerisporangium melleum]GGK61393.1 hypothetical protein GCM10007964_00670 [Sphaerisporangium melleum]GII67837.1 hypothetical protein Sme01_03130 [Sphaerisporangium melleum]